MSDWFYSIIKTLGSHAFWVSSSPMILNRHRSAMKGAYILAATHFSPYDVPLLIRHSQRRLDFVSIVEVFAKSAVGWFYGNMNAFPLDRSKTDSKTVRIIRDRLDRMRASQLRFRANRISGSRPCWRATKIAGKGRIWWRAGADLAGNLGHHLLRHCHTDTDF